MAKKAGRKVICKDCGHEATTTVDSPRCGECGSRNVENMDGKAPGAPPVEDKMPPDQKFFKNMPVDPRVAQSWRFEVERHGYRGTLGEYVNERTLEAARARGFRPAMVVSDGGVDQAILTEGSERMNQSNQPQKPRDDLDDILEIQGRRLKQQLADATVSEIELEAKRRRIEMERERRELDKLVKGEADGDAKPREERPRTEFDEVREMLSGDIKGEAVQMLMDERRYNLELKRIEIEKKRKELELVGKRTDDGNNGGGNMVEEMVPYQMPDGSLQYKVVRHREGYQPMMPPWGMWGQGPGGKSVSMEDIQKLLEEKLEKKSIDEQIERVRQEQQQATESYRAELREKDKEIAMRDRQELLERIDEAKNMASNRTDRYDMFKELLGDLDNLNLGGRNKFSADDLAAKTANETVNKFAEVATQRLKSDKTAPKRLADAAELIVKKSIKDSTPDQPMEDYDDPNDLEIMYSNLNKELGQEKEQRKK